MKQLANSMDTAICRDQLSGARKFRRNAARDDASIYGSIKITKSRPKFLLFSVLNENVPTLSRAFNHKTRDFDFNATYQLKYSVNLRMIAWLYCIKNERIWKIQQLEGTLKRPWTWNGASTSEDKLERDKMISNRDCESLEANLAGPLRD